MQLRTTVSLSLHDPSGMDHRTEACWGGQLVDQGFNSYLLSVEVRFEEGKEKKETKLEFIGPWDHEWAVASFPVLLSV